MWVHNDDPLECGVRLPTHAINLWRKPALIADWTKGATLRELAVKYDVSRDTAHKWTKLLTRQTGASRRPKHG